VIFNDALAKVAEQYLKKGAKVYIEGQLQTRKWQDRDGNDRYTTEVVLQRFRGDLQMLSSNEHGQSGGGGSGRRDDGYGNQSGRNDNAGSSGGGRPQRDLDDEIPFAPEWR
jgi:single-strand DNA-binding protein